VRIDTRPVNDGVVRLAVSGEIDLISADDLTDAVDAVLAADRPAEVIVDLAEVTLCDSAGIDALLRARSAAGAQAVHLVVINPRGVVRRALDVTGTLDSLTAPPAAI
jgi:anti-sigma B factor antagonist